MFTRVNSRTLEQVFDEKLKELYEGRYRIKSNDILMGYIAAILFEYRYGRDTHQIFLKLAQLREEGFLDFSPSLKSTISIYLSNGAAGWAEFLTQGRLDDGPTKSGRPPGIYRLTDDARGMILGWKKKRDKKFGTFIKAHEKVKKEIL